MEWDEFTNYIIEKATVLKNLKNKAKIKKEKKKQKKLKGILFVALRMF